MRMKVGCTAEVEEVNPSSPEINCSFCKNKRQHSETRENMYKKLIL
jgi:hypothetical protein